MNFLVWTRPRSKIDFHWLVSRGLNPLDEGGDSFISDSFHLQDMLKDIEIDEFFKSLYPKVPVKKALECTREALEADKTHKRIGRIG